jgi:hypothetical protein
LRRSANRKAGTGIPAQHRRKRCNGPLRRSRRQARSA